MIWSVGTYCYWGVGVCINVVTLRAGGVGESARDGGVKNGGVRCVVIGECLREAGLTTPSLI